MASSLFSSIADLPSMDTQRTSLLSKLGIRRCADLLFYFPRTFEAPAPRTSADSFKDKLRVAFLGTVVDVAERVSQSGKHMLGVQVTVEGGASVRLLWFNQLFRRQMYRRGDRLLVSGELRSTGLNWEIIQPTVVAAEEAADADRPLPVYSLTEGLKQSMIRSIMRQCLPPLIEQVEEALPESLREQLQVPPVQEALNDIHFPPTVERAELAVRRFKLQELLVLQLALAMQRRDRQLNATAPACELTGKIHARILTRLGYTLTPDQLTAVEEVGQDMSRSVPMNRLLQGDVGSGKTLVAQYAMLLCVANQFQAAIMAPTEILARQHYLSLQRSLQASRVRIGLLIGALSKSQRLELLGQIGAGEIDLVVGTQALLSAEVQFRQLGLVIVDEQHRFGVLQRAAMRRDGLQPHYLVLSATPIPRTVAMTAFGDLDLSTIRTKPPGRCQVHTYLTDKSQLGSWWQFVDKQIAQGRQAYVIAPRVVDTQDNEELVGSAALASAEGTYRQLLNGPMAHRRIGLLHGRLDSEVKEQVLQSFSQVELDILVATTVVEVGIDVPNATVITILDADRLGLAQLHQLRGRVARGRHPGYACAVTSDGCLASENQRLQAFQRSDDGFELAEMDLQLRGPGDLLGTSQKGLPPMRLANVVTDAGLLIQAREVASQILKTDPHLADQGLQKLVQQTLRRYGKSLQLGDVG